MTKHDKNLRILDAIFHQVALVEADEAPATPEVRRDVDAIMAHAHERLAEMRRREKASLLATAPAVITQPTVRPSIVAMARDAVLARLATLCAAHPGAILAHRDFAGMTDDDLRSALEDAESLAERAR